MDHCSAAYRYSIQLYLDGELDECDRQEILAHMESCAGCRREKEVLRHLSSRIRRARPTLAPSSALSDRSLCRVGHRARQAFALWRECARRKIKHQPWRHS
jgi:anti-sigma factor RsiW